MIKIFKRKNPELAEFKKFKTGYHVTKQFGWYSIQKSGFLKPDSYTYVSPTSIRVYQDDVKSVIKEINNVISKRK